MHAVKTTASCRSLVTLVTGASHPHGIGRAIAKKLITSYPHQHTLVLFGSRHKEALEQQQAYLVEYAKSIQSTADIVTIPLDLTHSQQVQDACKHVEAQYGGVQHLIHNAGVCQDSLLVTQPLDHIQQQIDMNLTSILFLNKCLIKGMMRAARHQPGSIIHISSVTAIQGHSGQAVYSATKAALLGLTRSLARELGSRHIRVNAILPGYIDTAMTQHLPSSQKTRILDQLCIKRFGKPEDIAEAVDFLCKADYMTGQSLVIDGGLTV